MYLPWARVQSELKQIHVLDSGCGSGRYGEQLQKVSGNRLATYLGIDESNHPAWPDRMRKFPFIQLIKADSADFSSLIPHETNLFISQSAIEHFPKDLVYFDQIAEFIRTESRPVIQIHLFPSAACLELYGHHGIRQYTPRTVSLIASRFPRSHPTLFRLGNARCNRIHYEYITTPVLHRGEPDKRETNSAEYARKVRQAITSPANGEASFYALVMQSNLKTQILDA